jgi:hypothetical protein
MMCMTITAIRRKTISPYIYHPMRIPHPSTHPGPRISKCHPPRRSPTTTYPHGHRQLKLPLFHLAPTRHMAHHFPRPHLALHSQLIVLSAHLLLQSQAFRLEAQMDLSPAFPLPQTRGRYPTTLGRRRHRILIRIHGRDPDSDLCFYNCIVLLHLAFRHTQ